MRVFAWRSLPPRWYDIFLTHTHTSTSTNTTLHSHAPHRRTPPFRGRPPTRVFYLSISLSLYLSISHFFLILEELLPVGPYHRTRSHNLVGAKTIRHSVNGNGAIVCAVLRATFYLVVGHTFEPAVSRYTLAYTCIHGVSQKNKT